MMKSINEKCNDSTMKDADNTNINNEEKLFCLSLVPKLKRLPPRLITAAQLKILQVLNDVEATAPATRMEPVNQIQMPFIQVQPNSWTIRGDMERMPQP